MKKLSFYVAVGTFFFGAVSMVHAQQWLGSATSTGNIYRNGNVGIGNTTSPAAWLHVSMSAGIPMRLERTGGGNQNNALEVGFTSNPSGSVVVGAGSVFFKSVNSVGVADMVFMHNANDAGMVIKSTGNIGMGTVNPTHHLHVHTGGIKVSGGVPGYGGPMVLFGSANADGSGVEDWGIEYINSATSSHPGLNFWKPFGSVNPGNFYLFLGDNGNIGIGTDNPGSFKLAVEGKLGAREVKVTLTNPWPDYVFQPGYVPMTLDEIDAYLKENKHLPGIPSADEVCNNDGIELGDMQVRQMEKIEELYLLLIDMNKQIKILTAENEQLKSLLSATGK